MKKKSNSLKFMHIVENWMWLKTEGWLFCSS